MTSRSSPPQGWVSEAVEQFVYRFGESHRLLACHVALPLLLTPELVNYLRTYFLYGQVPWEAEVDILLSDFCRPVGYEQYVMDAEVRAYLLRQMEDDPHLGTARMQKVASLLIKYVQYLYRTYPQKRSQELQAQQWAAMVFLEDQREKAVRQIAEAFQQSMQLEIQQQGRSLIDEPEMARLAKLTQELAPQLENYPELIQYAQVVSELLRQPLEARRLDANNQHYSVQNVALPELTNFLPPELEPILLRPGIPVRHPQGGTGTLGCFVRKRGQPQIYLLSVSHALVPTSARVGDPIVRPETLSYQDKQGEEIATLVEYIQPDPHRILNTVDVAIAAVFDYVAIEPTDISGTGLGTLKGVYSGNAEDLLGKRVRKIGAASGLTEGTIQAVGMHKDLPYPIGQVTYENLIGIISVGNQPFVQLADNGALVVDDEGYAIGIIVSGNESNELNQNSLALAIPIQAELDALGLELVLNMDSLAQPIESDPSLPELKTLEFETGQLVEETTLPASQIPNLPHLQTETFDIVTIKIDEPEYSSTVNLIPFSFETATLEWAPTLRRRWQIRREENHAEHYIEQLSDNVALDMVAIPGGSFTMGSPEDEQKRDRSEGPQHDVQVQPFYIGRYLVTQAQWRAVAAMPSVQRDLYPNPSRFEGDTYPVERVSWLDAVEFCARLSRHSGRAYRLPSEAEWEYACRAGTTTPFHFGETISPDLANYDGTVNYNEGPNGAYRRTTTAVDEFGVANAFGLCDMHGNIWEWCQDEWHDSYEGAPTDGSAWVNRLGALEGDATVEHVVRGGSWRSVPRDCRSAYRYSGPRYPTAYFGLRVVYSTLSTPL